MAPGTAATGRKGDVRAPEARRPARPVRRGRPDRPASPSNPASPVRPASPARPAGPGRPGRTIRTGGPARQLSEPATQARRAGLAPARAGTAAGRAGQIGRSSFVLLVLGLLGGGLICLLVVNTTLAANSIEIGRLQQANTAATQRVQQLQQAVTTASSAAVLEKEALRLGMRPAPGLTFVDLPSGRIVSGADPGQGASPDAQIRTGAGQ